MISAVILKLASLCNLNCTYCYMYNHEDKSYLRRPKLISDETFDATLAVMKRYCEKNGTRMALNFHGGEPTLIGAKRFGVLAGRAREVLGESLSLLAMQTNATLIDDAWIEVLQQHRVHVGVSLDGPREINDVARVDHAGRGSYDTVLVGLRRLQAGGLSPRVLSVVNPGSSGADAYEHLRSLGLDAFDFLLPDVSHDNKRRFYGAFGDTPVADFLIPAFDAWLAEENPAIEIRLFADVVHYLLGGEMVSDSFGNPLMGYLIVDTDGAIEALDALRVCDDGIAASGLNVLRAGFEDLAHGLPLVYQAVEEGFPLPRACARCPERELCGGGYLPHRYSRANGFDNPSVWCADILAFLAHVRERIEPFADARALAGFRG
jgi:uncharacterized protein